MASLLVALDSQRSLQPKVLTAGGLRATANTKPMMRSVSEAEYRLRIPRLDVSTVH